jgi:hypothetical protein
MAGKSAILSIKILTDARQAQQGLDQTAKSAGKFKSGLGTASKFAAGALAAVGVAALSAGRAAAEDAQAQALLATAMRNSAHATDAQIASTEDWISKTAAATGVADDQLRPALASLVRATGDVTKSQDAMNVALDVAAATGKPVEAVAVGLAKGYAGNTKALGKLVPGIDKATLASGDMSKVMAELAAKTGGSAAAAAGTAAGKMAIATNAINEAKESIGAGLLPVMASLAIMLGKVGQFAQQHATAVQIAAVAIAAMAVAVIALNAAMTIYTAVTTLAASATLAAWGAALLPILLVLAAIGLVVAIVVLLWKRSETFRTIVLAVWGAIRTGAQALATAISAAWNRILATVTAVIGWIKRNWQILLAGLAGPLGLAVLLIIRNWDKIKAAVNAVITWIRSQWDATMNALKGGASQLGDILTAPFRAMEDAVQSVLDKIGHLLDKVKGIHLPNIPGLGRVAGVAAAAPTGARMAMTAAPSVMGLGAVTGRASVAPRAGTTVVIQGAVDPEATARQVRRILDRHDGRIGLRGVLRTS